MDELERQLAAFVRDSPLQRLNEPFPEPLPIHLYLKRDDLLHPLVSGNKWRKLKYNLLEARRLKADTLVTFGGAFSNHLYATAAAGQVFGFRTVGIIRGEEYTHRDAPTLAFCRQAGMQVYAVSRTMYREITIPERASDASDFVTGLTRLSAGVYVLPEGGTNGLAVQGTAELLPELNGQLGRMPDFVCCPVGTGGTVAGLVSTAPPATTVVGFSALKGGGFLNGEVDRLLGYSPENLRIQTEYPFGGYAKTTPDLLAFIRLFEQKTGVRIEQVYTGKMLFGLYDLARKGFFPTGSSVVAVHTGGLQGRSPVLDTY
ncbi:Pyridoxal-5'-phosphate-dependent protein beta subunit [Fibrisoma limi BUZ 3]|uniref:Pyridoxal-5'-phosphate-dependent protein beta subunit n=1 Tax=Fibrisoma limi BUZ 3 TaxID=1185876 RepID=I2GDR6_9BACT|nr:pyridoxal-phosphate dependent enzyme [Fibrisoma limi]CCH52040.1 Pyridoxal-5'-phosphate-dependent protein beta subunit [Fibrisoma limi BUZ 3]